MNQKKLAYNLASSADAQTNKQRQRDYYQAETQTSYRPQKDFDSVKKKLIFEEEINENSNHHKNNESTSNEDNTMNNISIQNQFSLSLKQENKTEKAKSNSSKNDELDSSVKRSKSFSEAELERVRSRLQQRLNELEPLPELLKNNEIKLQDALLKLKHLEQQNSEYKNQITKLRFQLELSEKENALNKKESNNNKKKMKDSSAQNSARLTESITSAIKQVEKNAKQTNLVENLNKIEPLNNKLRLIEGENKELLRFLGLKEDLIRDLTVI